jgi:hypothetical protein
MHINPLDADMCLCYLLLCDVLRVLFSNACKSSRCAYVCALSCCVLCCVFCSRMNVSPLDADMCLCWWVVFSSVVCCAACLVLTCSDGLLKF